MKNIIIGFVAATALTAGVAAAASLQCDRPIPVSPPGFDCKDATRESIGTAFDTSGTGDSYRYTVDFRKGTSLSQGALLDADGSFTQALTGGACNRAGDSTKDGTSEGQDCFVKRRGSPAKYRIAVL